MMIDGDGEDWATPARCPPVVLFLVAQSCRTGIARMAQELGFGVVTTGWRWGEPSPRGIVVRRGIDGVDASARPLLGVTTLRPAVVATLDRSPLAVSRARELVLACDAWWADCDPVDRQHGAVPGAQYVGSAVVEFDPSAPGGYSSATGDARDAALEALGRLAEQRWNGAPPIQHRTCAPVTVWRDATGQVELVSAFAPELSAFEPALSGVHAWLVHLRTRLAMAPVFELPEPEAIPHRSSQWPVPSLFGTPDSIETAAVPSASAVYLDPALAACGPDLGVNPANELLRLIARERSREPAADDGRRVVPPGVGRACLVSGVHLQGSPQFHDFTVLGIGLTPYSEGGYVEIGREIDGKASLVRAWHRKRVAEILEANGGRSAKVVAIFASTAGDIGMPDGSRSPAALVVRAFRSEMRVKQLDPLICYLHSTQHTPLVSAFLRDQAIAIGRARGIEHVRDPRSDELLAQAIEGQGPSQESLRELLDHAAGGDRSWLELVRTARLDVIDAYVGALLPVVFDRLERELELPSGAMTRSAYVDWFAIAVGRQLARWRELRFLHDYHHPGVGRWRPNHLYTLGENNVTLLAEFPDLDTGVFVDDPAGELAEEVHLGPADVEVLRTQYVLFHRRDVVAARLVVRSLALLVDSAHPVSAEHADHLFEDAYRDG